MKILFKVLVRLFVSLKMKEMKPKGYFDYYLKFM